MLSNTAPNHSKRIERYSHSKSAIRCKIIAANSRVASPLIREVGTDCMFCDMRFVVECMHLHCCQFYRHIRSCSREHPTI